MMDELDLLKKDWQSKEKDLPKLSYNDIYTMIWKKSSSIVKWMFYISIFELVFWVAMAVLPLVFDSFNEKMSGLEDSFTQTFIWISNTITFGVILIFIYFLYQSYRGISASDNVKSLMESILKTRKIIKYYVAYNLIMAFLVTLFILYHTFTNDQNSLQIIEPLIENGSALKLWLVIGVIGILLLVLILGFIWLFYQLIYGFLLRKLNRNYGELKRLEM